MSDLPLNSTVYREQPFRPSPGTVKDKISLFPEVHIYKTELKDQQTAPRFTKGKKVKEGKTNKKGRIQKIFLIFILFLFCILAGELVFHFFISSKLLIKKVKIEVSGTLELSNDEILRIAGLGDESYYFRFKPVEAEAQLLDYPLIKEAAVKKQFPDSVTINITGRSPLALCLVETNEGHIPVVFDQDGVVFQIGKTVQKLDTLCISGIRFSELKLGMRLPEQIMPLMNDLEMLKTESPSLFQMLSEIKIINKGNDRVEAVLFTDEHTVPVHIGMNLNEQQLMFMFMVLDVITEEEFAGTVEELDLRSGEIVYRTKEAVDAQ